MVRARIVLGFLAVLVAGLALPSPAHACSCIRSEMSSVELRYSDRVFIGTASRVDGPKPWARPNPDGSTSVGITHDPLTVTFGAIRSFKGAGAKEMIVRGDGCHVPFKTGETWLVYARERDGLITTGSCSRTRLLAEAAQDIAYLEGLEERRDEIESVANSQARSDTPAVALERAEAKWRERGPKSYTYGVMLTCLCSPKGMDVRVVDGRAQLPDTATAATKGFHEAYGTIEALFERIRRAIDAGGHRVNVKYHDELGYPISAVLDPRRDVIDDEVFIRVTGFRALPERR